MSSEPVKKYRYIIIGNSEPAPDQNWEQVLVASTGVSRTFAKAYDLAKFFGKMNSYNQGYRVSLEQIKRRGAITLYQKDNPNLSATIIKTRLYI